MPHPEGIHPAVCVDVMDLGLCETDFQGTKKMVEKVKITFESEQKTADGKACTVFRSFSASLHPKSNLAAFLSRWRAKPVAPGESIDLQKLIGASCTLVISHQKNLAGKTYASIDAVSKPTKRVAPSGQYDPAAARQRYADWQTKSALKAAAPVAQVATPRTSPQPSPQSGEGVDSRPAPAPGPSRTGEPFDNSDDVPF